MISAERNNEFTVINQEGFYKRFCAAQDFVKFMGEDITINNIEAIDYTEWQMEFHEVQRSSIPLFGSRAKELLIEKFDFLYKNENAALLMLMGQGLLAENGSINMSEAIDYNEWEMIVHEVQRSSTPLFGSRESEVLVIPFEKQDAALFMLMGQRIIDSEY